MRQGSASDQIPQDVGYQDPEDLSTAHSFDPFNFDFGGDGAFDDGTAWDESGLPSNSVPLEGGTMNLPSLGNDTSAASSVITSASSDQGSSESLLPPVNSLKRPHPSSSSQAGPSQQGSSKLRCMTPSPAATYPSTPTSLDSLEVAEQGFAQQHGSVLGNGNAVASRALMRQRLAEEAASKRRQSQLRDAQLAQALHQELHPERPQSTYRSPQTYLNPDGSVQRAVASSSSAVLPTSSEQQQRAVLPFKNEHGTSTPGIPYMPKARPDATPVPDPHRVPGAYPTPASIHRLKTEQGRLQSKQPGVPSEVVDLTGDSSEEDFKEVTSRSLQPGGRSSQPSQGNLGFGGDVFCLPHKPQANNQLVDLDRYQSSTSRNRYAGPSSGLALPNRPIGGHDPATTSWMTSAASGLRDVGAHIGEWVDDISSLNRLINPGAPSSSGMSSRGTYGAGHSFGHLPAKSYTDFDPTRDVYGGRYDPYTYLPADPTKTKEELQELINNIQDEDFPPEMRVGTPSAMSYPLMEHQKIGLAWLKKMEEGSSKGGILADDMGLGKTIQALALMVSRRSGDPLKKTTLIVAPVALMKQWQKEIKEKLKNSTQHSLTVIIHHGANKAKSFNTLRHYDVVLTTFGTLATELKRKELNEERRRAEDGAREDELALIGENCKWYRVIIDEAQCIKNKSTKTARAACYLNAESRFCMTGTPMMNNIGELYSLIRFLRIKPYNEWERFNLDFVRPLKSGNEYGKNKAMKQLQALLKAILLRRNKKSKIDGVPILKSLPERMTAIDHAVFDEEETNFYKALETQTQLKFNKYLKAGTVGKNYSNLLVLLLRLRQACCHPHLIRDFGQVASVTAGVSPEDLEELARSFSHDVVIRIKAAQGAFECPICMDAVENPSIFIPCGHDTCSECLVRLCDPAQALANGDESGTGSAKCPECREKIDPKKVVDYNTFRKVHMPETLPEGEEVVEDTIESEETTETEDSETESDDDDDDDDDEQTEDEDETLGGFIVKDDIEDDEATENEAHPEENTVGSGSSETKSAKKGKKAQKPKKDRKGKGKVKDAKPKLTLAELKKQGQRNIAAKKKYLRRLQRTWISSAKIEKTMELMREIIARKDSPKTIIFSQWTSLLDLLEVPISKEGWGYRRYDGSMSSRARNDAVEDFGDRRKDIKVMLVSLKAGNAGLNLTMASQVIILDPFWNPFIEEQAIDRAHRIGQQHTVEVHRILVEETVEDRIVELQEKKRALISQALDEKASQSIGRLGVQELAYLF
ncbi:hypothetical protein LTR16_003014, partial [Cryomyces antarcticus]